MDEKQIDELARMIIEYVKTGNGDVRIEDQMYLFCDSITYLDQIELVDYFLKSLRREYTDPEVIQRSRKE